MNCVLCTDNVTVSGVTLSEEYHLAQSTFDFTPEEMLRLIDTGFRSAFLSYHQRERLRSEAIMKCLLLFENVCACVCCSLFFVCFLLACLFSFTHHTHRLCSHPTRLFFSLSFSLEPRTHPIFLLYSLCGWMNVLLCVQAGYTSSSFLAQTAHLGPRLTFPPIEALMKAYVVCVCVCVCVCPYISSCSLELPLLNLFNRSTLVYPSPFLVIVLVCCFLLALALALSLLLLSLSRSRSLSIVALALSLSRSLSQTQ
jgi:hypothetical protein